MPWNDITRADHKRESKRYPSDLTVAEWALIAPLLPPAKPGGRPRTTDLRDVSDAILYIASSGCQWRMLPKEIPPYSTVQAYFYDWRDSGLLQTINHLLVMSTRDLEGRETSPTAGVIDSQSVKTTESGGVSGYDAGKKIKGRKRHVFVDGGYAGEKLRGVLKGNGEWTIEIIKRTNAAEGFEVLPRRWVVERNFAWLGRCRRLAKDWEQSIESSTAWALVANIRLLTRRLARYCYQM